MDGDEPRSETKYPKNPAFMFKITPPDSDESEISIVGIGKNISPSGDNNYKLGIEEFENRDVIGLTVRRDYTLPFFIIVSIVFMVGVIQGMYSYHRRIWIHKTKKEVLLGSNINKNR